MVKAARRKKSKRNGVNRSEEIRKEISKHSGKVRPRDVIAALGARGLAVSAALVTNVMKRMKRRRKVRRAAVAIAIMPNDMISMAALKEAKKFVKQTGSVESAKQALDALSSLV